jgi:hypothetical protein
MRMSPPEDLSLYLSRLSDQAHRTTSQETFQVGLQVEQPNRDVARKLLRAWSPEAELAKRPRTNSFEDSAATGKLKP